MRRIVGLTLGLVFVAAGTVEAVEKRSASLRGSPATMQQQNRVAKEHGLTFYRTGADIEAAVARGELSVLVPNEDYDVADFVRFPYLQAEAVVFVERLAEQYREACGQKLVVTSAVRPASGQPSNAHQLSVHPAGMAVDLRVSDRASCRSWLETAILNMERRGLINGIREFRPPHYHIAIFPGPYMAYVEERLAAEEAERAAAEEERAIAVAEAVSEVSTELVSTGGATMLVAETDVSVDGRSASPLTAALVVLFALPVGLGVLIRRSRKS
jgi:hypothetical protein